MMAATYISATRNGTNVLGAPLDVTEHEYTKCLVFVRLTYLEQLQAVSHTNLALSLKFEDIIVRLGRLEKSLTIDYLDFDAVARSLAKHWAKTGHKEMEAKETCDLTIPADQGAVLHAVRVLDESALDAFITSPEQTMPYMLRVLTLKFKALEVRPVGPFDLRAMARMVSVIRTMNTPSAGPPNRQTSLAQQSLTHGPPPFPNAPVGVQNNRVAELIEKGKTEIQHIFDQLDGLGSQIRDMVNGPSSGVPADGEFGSNGGEGWQ